MKINSNISFYNVPLVCNAVTSIGCGSRSKPVLLDLEKQPEISQAWLNRKGTSIAVVWNRASKSTQRKIAVNKVFAANNINATEVSNKKYTTNLNSFSIPNQWLQGDDINKLSKEEAKLIANQLLLIFKQKALLSDIQESNLNRDIQEVFYNFFLNYKSLNDLADTKVYRQKMQDILKLSTAYLPKQNLPKEDDLLNACTGHSNGDNSRSGKNQAK